MPSSFTEFTVDAVETPWFAGTEREDRTFMEPDRWNSQPKCARLESGRLLRLCFCLRWPLFMRAARNRAMRFVGVSTIRPDFAEPGAR